MDAIFQVKGRAVGPAQPIFVYRCPDSQIIVTEIYPRLVLSICIKEAGHLF
jgi:hypothetical protein